MRAWRIYDHRSAWARTVNADPLSGQGGVFTAGRWNPLGMRMVYTAASPSLAVLETIVHVSPFDFRERTLLEIELPEGSLESVPERVLIQLLRNAPPLEPDRETQRFGQAWVDEGRSLVLEVPSLVMPIERNYLLNPLHPLMKEVRIVNKELVTLDPRLYRA